MSSSLRSNYFYNACLTAANLFIPLVSFWYIAPIFRPEIYGQISFTQSIANYFLLIAAIGIPLYGAREIAKVRNRPKEKSVVFSELLAINFLSSIVATTLYALSVLLVPKLAHSKGLLSVYGLLLLFNIFSVDWVFQGEERYRNIALRNAFFRVTMLMAIIFLVKKADQYILFALIGVCSIGAGNFVGYLTIRRDFRLVTRGLNLHRHLPALFILLGSAVAASVYLYLDTVMLGFIAGDYHVGLYAAATRINRMALTLVLSLGNAALPRITYYLSENKIDDYNILVKKSFQLTTFFSFGAAFFFLFFAGPILEALTQNVFTEATTALRILSALFIMTVASSFIGFQVLFPAGKEKALIVCSSLAAVTNIIANLVLIPRYQHNGAAVAAIIAESTALVTLCILAHKKIRLSSLLGMETLTFAIVGLAAGIVGFFFVQCLENVWLQLIVGSIVFCIVYIVPLIFFKQTIFIRQLLYSAYSFAIKISNPLM